MSERRLIPHIHPLFYDVLAGEFSPPTDPRRRSHTLGRVAYAAYTRGQLVTGSIEGAIDHFTRHPAALHRLSWAPANALVSGSACGDNGVHMRRLLLTSDRARTFMVEHHLPEGEGDDDTISIVDRAGEQRFDLTSGPDGLAVARLAITQRAQEFFNSINT